MIKNSGKISNIERKASVFYFSFKGYIWAIWLWSEPDESNIESDLEGYSLAYYPNAKNISELTTKKVSQDFIVYTSSDFRKALNSFEQLYKIIREKYFEVDKVFENILKD